ncbi:NADP-dependent oxidoreductase [Sulfitobacter sp. D35]|uniref:NADP-dependent oxidoreductase n=1 Tax=Sulfitobacter sp. D35 TaxID=3083252 RepID=UPI00296EE7B2|nr:NADP-dependent oxidoreductase [Sulfitobacter sp. D35]MDW4497899.1 NADP-dependent oxidoreductase [Sulfitobacter sp. D35]
MKALILNRYGDPDVLNLADLPEPQTSGGDGDLVTVTIHISGVNPIDIGVRAGGVLPDEPERFPMVLGWDGAGIVDAVGSGVAGLSVGDRVMVLTKQPSSGIGTHQDVVALPKAQVVKLPDSVTFEQAAAAPLASITALNSVEALGLRPGQTIHINNVEGAVGRAAAQIARALGLKVVDDPAPASMDGAIDVWGEEKALAAFATVKNSGAYATTIPEWWKPGGQYQTARGITPITIENSPTETDLERIVAWLADGSLDPKIEAVLPLAEGAKAHAMLAAPGLTHKLLLSHV